MLTTVIYLPQNDSEEIFDFECNNCGSDDIEETSTHCPECHCEIDWDNSI